MIELVETVTPLPQRTLAMRRSTFIRSLLAGLASLALGGPVLAQESYKIMIGGSLGGGYDQTGRGLGRALQEAGQAKTVTYDNKGGAGGTLALAQFARSAKGDPHALLVVGAVMVGAIVQDKPPVSLDALTPVARLLTEYNVVVVPAGSSFKSMKEVLDQMKRDPASVKWGGDSLGSIDHIAVAMLAREIGVDVTKVNYTPFKGGADVLSSLASGKITVGTSGLAEMEQGIKKGELRGLAVTAANKLPGSQIPALSELGVNVIVGNWRGVYGAADITPEQRQALIEAVTKASKTNVWAETLNQNRWFRSVMLTGDAFAHYVEEDLARKRAIMLKLGML
jgi:putative tricarboxylic transport membrane protein